MGYPETAYFEVGMGKVVKNAITYGCGDDKYDLACSAEDRKKYAGKWLIREMTTAEEPELGCDASVDKPCKVLAVCKEGCPDAVDDKGHPFYWPADASAKKWDVLDLETGSATSADNVNVFCCKRLAQKCDKCHPSDCGTILPLSCNPITKILNPCCMWDYLPAGGACICQGSMTFATTLATRSSSRRLPM